MVRKRIASKRQNDNRSYSKRQSQKKVASTTSRSRKRFEVSSRPGIEFYSIFIICLSAVMFISLLTQHAGIIGNYIRGILIFLFGPVAILAPATLVILALGMIIKKFRSHLYKLMGASFAWLVLYPTLIVSFVEPKIFYKLRR